MIPAAKRAGFERWFAATVDARLRRHFAQVDAFGLEHLERAAAMGPVIVVSNHCSWWDPVWAIVLSNRVLRLDAYALMDARNLRRLPFFARVGAFGVDLDQPRDGARAVRYARRLLDRPGRAVFVFPQGAERPSSWRPLGFRAGAAAIARGAPDARVVPMALRYEHTGDERPHLLVAFGAPLEGEPPAEGATAPRGRALEAGVAAQEATVEALLQLLDARLESREGARTLHRFVPSWWSTWSERVLAWLARDVLAGEAQPDER